MWIWNIETLLNSLLRLLCNHRICLHHQSFQERLSVFLEKHLRGGFANLTNQNHCIIRSRHSTFEAHDQVFFHHFATQFCDVHLFMVVRKVINLLFCYKVCGFFWFKEVRFLMTSLLFFKGFTASQDRFSIKPRPFSWCMTSLPLRVSLQSATGQTVFRWGVQKAWAAV